jgi:hypothetical protein
LGGAVINWDAIGAIGEIVGAAAVVVSLVYLAQQMRMSNKLARSEAFRIPNAQLNSVNATFGLDPVFQPAIRKILNGAQRTELEPNERTALDYYLVSACNIYDQLSREMNEGILGSNARDFGGKGLFELPYFAESWPLYKQHLSSKFVAEMERDFDLSVDGNPEW